MWACKFLPQVGLVKKMCRESSMEKTNLKTKKKYWCTHCGKEFTSWTGLNLHSQHHTGQYKHFCYICRKGFVHINAYEQHMRVHMGDNFACQYCEKRFISKQRLKYHQSVHTGVYRFKCDVCNKGYNDRRQFLMHKEIHKQWAGSRGLSLQLRTDVEKFGNKHQDNHRKPNRRNSPNDFVIIKNQ